MDITKTTVSQEVVLNRQLVLLLLEFGWEGWHPKTERLVRRMTEWLGVVGYSFKSTIMEAVTDLGSNLSFAQQIAGHKSIRNTRIYIPGSKFRDILRVLDLVQIPGLDIRFGERDSTEILETLSKLSIPQLRYR